VLQDSTFGLMDEGKGELCITGFYTRFADTGTMQR
jgi:hypothetical protein